MGKRTLAIKHTLEKNLFYKLFNWLRNKTSISLLLAANRKRTTLVTIHLLKERWHNQPFKSWRGWKFFSFYVYKTNVWQQIAKKEIFTTRHLAQSYDSCDLSRRVQVASKFKEKRYKNVAWLLQYKATTLTECDATNADVLKLLGGCSFNPTDEYSDNVLRPLPPRHLYEVGHTWTTLKTSPDKSFNK